MKRIAIIGVFAVLAGCDEQTDMTPQMFHTAVKWCEPHQGLWVVAAYKTGLVDQRKLVASCVDGTHISRKVNKGG